MVESEQLRPVMTRAARRRARRERRLGLQSRTVDPKHPQSPPPESDSAILAGLAQAQPAPADPGEDIELAKQMIEGGWKSPVASVARLLCRLTEAGQSRYTINTAIAAANTMTKIFESASRSRDSGEADNTDLADRLAKIYEISQVNQGT